VVITLEFAWKLRWAAIMRTNCSAMSTLDCSSAPETTEARQSRLLLCDLTGRTIRQGLDLLGIHVVDKM